MDGSIVVLRLVHFMAGTFWVGAGLLMAFFVARTARILGAEARGFMQTFASHSHYEQAMAVSSLLTTLSGVLLYVPLSGGFSSAWVLSTPGLVLSIGAAAGILAFLIGLTVIGPTGARIEKLGHAMSLRQGPPSADEGRQMQQLQLTADNARKVALLLMVIAVAGMASARYL